MSLKKIYLKLRIILIYSIAPIIGWIILQASLWLGFQINLPVISDFMMKFIIFTLIFFISYCLFKFLFIVLNYVACNYTGQFQSRIEAVLLIWKSVLIFNIFIFFYAVFIYMTVVKLANDNYEKYKHVISNATSWSATYSENRFKQIKLGQEEKDVLHFLGEPLRRFEKRGDYILAYSDIGNYKTQSAGFFKRWVLLDKNSKVKAVINEYEIVD